MDFEELYHEIYIRFATPSHAKTEEKVKLADKHKTKNSDNFFHFK